jgi:hypothetical protein
MVWENNLAISCWTASGKIIMKGTDNNGEGKNTDENKGKEKDESKGKEACEG